MTDKTQAEAHSCINPQCNPAKCWDCACAIPANDQTGHVVVDLLNTFAVNDLGHPFEDGDSAAVDRARQWLQNRSTTLQAAPLSPAAVGVPAEVELPDVEDMAHSAVQEALSFGVNHDVFHRWMRAVMDKTVQAMAAAPAQQHATQLAGQALPADEFRGDTASLVRNIIALLDLDAQGCLVPHGVGGHARGLLSAAASRLAAAPAQAQEDTRDGLTKAVRDVLAERARQVERKGYDPEHDDSHVLGEIGALAALYLMPDGARSWDASSTGYGDTLSEALLPSGWSLPAMGDDCRADAVKGVACGLAEIERLDRAAARAAQGGAA